VVFGHRSASIDRHDVTPKPFWTEVVLPQPLPCSAAEDNLFEAPGLDNLLTFLRGWVLLQGIVPQAWGAMKSLKTVTLFENPGLKGCLPAALKTAGVKLGRKKGSNTSSSSSSSSGDVDVKGKKGGDDNDDDSKESGGAAAAAKFAAAVSNTGITGWC
jgi:hypothetical protein